eukprot:365796-Chlamydomonas_euryale.AAC.14
MLIGGSVTMLIGGSVTMLIGGSVTKIMQHHSHNAAYVIADKARSKASNRAIVACRLVSRRSASRE